MGAKCGVAPTKCGVTLHKVWGVMDNSAQKYGATPHRAKQLRSLVTHHSAEQLRTVRRLLRTVRRDI
ncbi:Hypothetical predicted protein [Olea europaea subsp. europaea]|uniref:Uncharacterized protein n=1 Tax=Olea europaea subsp. europaea TaxID=158383 RepID=A0A8S0VHT2_OLEEU|nr:Hypothetical predicted protein [Olea europaea subsp. europaea]